MKYAVYENKKPAKYPNYPVSKDWDNNKFDSYAEAYAYVLDWVGAIYKTMIPDKMVCNHEYPFNGYSDTISIREMKH